MRSIVKRPALRVRRSRSRGTGLRILRQLHQMLQSALMNLEPGARLAHYEIVGLIGKGGMTFARSRPRRRPARDQNGWFLKAAVSVLSGGRMAKSCSISL